MECFVSLDSAAYTYVPSTASGGNANIVYGVIAGILAGAVAGDHASPISDTTILGAMASECMLLNHVKTQAPYAATVATWSVLVGTLPSGRGAFGNGICTLLGLVFMIFHAFFTSAPAINKTGRYDIFTEIYLKFSKNEDLLDLKEKSKQVFETGETLALTETGEEITKPLKGDEEDMKDQGEEFVIDGEDTSTDNAGAGEGGDEDMPQVAGGSESDERAFAESAISA